jgi:hypothetical protein
MSERSGARTGVGSREILRAQQRVSQQGPEADARARRLGESRPELVAYLVSATRALSPAARRAAWQGFELVCEALRALELPRVTLTELLEAQCSNDELALRLGTAHPRFADRWLHHGEGLRQRALLALLARDAMARAPMGERGALFLVLKTVVDVLDRSRRDQGNTPRSRTSRQGTPIPRSRLRA